MPMASWDYGDSACKHGRDVYTCTDCDEERNRKQRQKEHEASVIRQKAKLITPRWKAQ